MPAHGIKHQYENTLGRRGDLSLWEARTLFGEEPAREGGREGEGERGRAAVTAPVTGGLPALHREPAHRDAGGNGESPPLQPRDAPGSPLIPGGGTPGEGGFY